jgi:hypothetical protein
MINALLGGIAVASAIGAQLSLTAVRQRLLSREARVAADQSPWAEGPRDEPGHKR